MTVTIYDLPTPASPDVELSPRAEVAMVRNNGLLNLTRYMAYYGDATAQANVIAGKLRNVDARIQREILVTMKTQRIKCDPDVNMVLGRDYDIREESYDYYRTQYAAYGFMRTIRRPIVSVERVRLMFGPENTIVTYPATWIRIDHKSGQISIVPTPGAGWSGIVLQTGQYFLPYLSNGWCREAVPQIIAVDYTAGLGLTAQAEYVTWTASIGYLVGDAVVPTVDNGHWYRCTVVSGTSPYASGSSEPTWITDGTTVVDNEVTWTDMGLLEPAYSEFADLREQRYRLAAQSCMKDLANAVTDGGLSRSLGEDGVSESISFGRMPFSGMIDQIDKDWEQFKANWTATEIGIQFTVV